MRTLLFPVATLLLGLSAVAIPACATGNDSVAIGGEDGGEEDSSTAPPPVIDAGVKETSSGPVCVSSCSADSECQNSCAPVSTGANCCDIGTKKCYVESQACPVEVPDSGPPPGPY